MTEDISALARAVRRLDASATFRSFAVPGALFAAWIYLARLTIEGVGGLYGVEIVFFAILAALGAAVAPLLGVLYDAFARQAWRPVSGAIALAAGGLGHAVYGGGLVILLGALIALPFDPGLASALAQGWAELRAGVPGAGLGAALVAIVVVFYVLAPVWILRRVVQAESELAGPTPRAVLLGDLGGAGLWARLAYLFGVPSSLWRAGGLVRPELWLFIAARVAVYGAALPASALVAELGEGGLEPARAGILIAAGAGLLVGGHLLFAIAKRLAARRIWQERPATSRRPILFLRSFEDDQFDFKRPWFDLLGRWLGLWSFRRNADEVLIDEFARDGEIIALGHPGETRTPFGAARRYVDHDVWQGVVRDAVKGAAAVVVAAGQTPGLKWEYELLKREGALDKTIFLFPPAGAREDSSSREHALRNFRTAFPDLAVERPEHKALIAVRAAKDGPRAILAASPDVSAYVVALRGFVQERDAAAGYRVGDGPLPVGALLGAVAGFLVGAVVMMIVGESMFG
jgi:hypothetical protein